jgi:hypothetical protein
MSLQSAVQHLSTSAGATLSTAVLHERADQSLAGMATLAIFAIAVSAGLPVMALLLERRLQQRHPSGRAGQS